jgi:uncharacterized membrane protein YphA (DoxX/SURF4 family)
MGYIFRKISLVLQTILFAAFFLSGYAKLIAAPKMVALFEAFGYPTFSLYVVGALEMALAVGLVIRRTRIVSAVGLLLIMGGAGFSHVIFDYEPNMLGVNITLATFAFAVAVWTRFGPKPVIEKPST